MPQQELLPSHFLAEGTQLKVVGDPSHDDFLEALDRLAKVETRINWYLGDLLCWAHEKFGPEQIRGYAAKWNKEESTFREYRRVSATWKPEDRDPELTWTHHQYCSGFKTREERLSWLNKAKVEGWSVIKLTRAIRAERDDAKLRREILDNKFKAPRDKVTKGKVTDLMDVCDYIETCTVGELNRIRKAIQKRAIMQRIAPGRKSAQGNVAFSEWWDLWPAILQKEKADSLGIWNQLSRNNENMGVVYEKTQEYLDDPDVKEVGPTRPRLFLLYQFWKLGRGKWSAKELITQGVL